MILVADSGSTSTAWCLIHTTGEKTVFDTEGYNPYYVDETYIVRSIRQHFPPGSKPDQVREVHFYGAGCMGDKTAVMEKALQSAFQKAKVYAAIDLLASARALLGRKAGFAAILGTGTNTCIYDGNKIIHNIDSLGYMLGDEGSGSYIGKKLLQEYMRELMPEPLREKFRVYVKLSFDEIMDRVYTQPLANRFCAAFTRFAGDYIETPYLRQLVKSSFVDFFNNLVSQYPGFRNYSFNCLGSVGFYFKSILLEVAEQFGMPVGRIILSPMEDLVNYHLQPA
jgi:N-acetylglucosamine kinase-like BadF-type ATPase